MIQQRELDVWFVPQAPQPGQDEHMEVLLAAMKVAAECLVRECPDSPYVVDAITHMRSAVMCAHMALQWTPGQAILSPGVSTLAEPRGRRG